MTDQEALQLFKCLADRSRLQILKSLAIEDMDVERLADRLELTAPTVISITSRSWWLAWLMPPDTSRLSSSTVTRPSGSSRIRSRGPRPASHWLAVREPSGISIGSR